MMGPNRQWRLARYPQGLPKPGDWVLAQSRVPEPAEGEVLVRALYLDVAPYMRARISPQKNYAAGVTPGEVMMGGAVGQVVSSRAAALSPGQLVVTPFNFGWQEFAARPASDFRRVDPELAPLPAWLDFLGFNGPTAYFGLMDAGRLRPGDTVVVSAAAGSVGQLVGQIARIAGARAVAVTSSAEKVSWCLELGFHAALNYRAGNALESVLADACPGGVDLYFDNTAGPIHDAVMAQLAAHARIVICGTVALADRFGEPDIGPRFLRQILVSRATVQGFLVNDHAQRFDEAWQRLARWYADGRLRTRFDVAEGIEQAPEAFIRLLTSQNTGKQVVKLAEPG